MGSFFKYIETIEGGHLMLLKYKNGNITEVVEFIHHNEIKPTKKPKCFNILSL